MLRRSYYKRPTYATILLSEAEAEKLRARSGKKPKQDNQNIPMTEGKGFPKSSDAKHPGEQPSYQQRVSVLADRAQEETLTRPVGYGVSLNKPKLVSEKSRRYHIPDYTPSEFDSVGGRSSIGDLKIPKLRKPRAKRT